MFPCVWISSLHFVIMAIQEKDLFQQRWWLWTTSSSSFKGGALPAHVAPGSFHDAFFYVGLEFQTQQALTVSALSVAQPILFIASMIDQLSLQMPFALIFYIQHTLCSISWISEFASGNGDIVKRAFLEISVVVPHCAAFLSARDFGTDSFPEWEKVACICHEAPLLYIPKRNVCCLEKIVPPSRAALPSPPHPIPCLWPEVLCFVTLQETRAHLK